MANPTAGISTSSLVADSDHDHPTAEIIRYVLSYHEVIVKHRSLVTLLIMLAATLSAGAQGLKLGYVDSQKIFEGLPEAQKAQKELDAKLQVWQDSLENMSRAFQSQYETYQAQQSTMTEAASKVKQQELLKIQAEIQEYRTKKFSQQGGEAAALRTKILQPLQEKVLKAIEEIAKEEKLNFMFDKIQDATIVLFADPKFDYTFKVLDRLKRGTN
jgi:outer membrane protein